jgi:hypothetical protein
MNLLTVFSAIVCCALVALVLRRLTRRSVFGYRRALSTLRIARGLLVSNVGAFLPGATTSLSETAAGVSLGTDLICVLSCMSGGTDLSSGGELRLFTNPNDINAIFGRGEGYEFGSLYIPATAKPILFGSLASTVAATLGNVDTTGVTGTSVVTFSGTPTDDVEIQISAEAAFTVGTTGGSLAFSLDGGQTWSGNYRMGTATSFLIPNTGITANFTAGTLNLADVASCIGVSPKWSTQAITDAFAALKAYNAIPRLVMILGDISDQSHLEAVTAAILDYETSVNRFSRVVCQARDRYAKAIFQGAEVRTAQLAGQTVTVAASGETYTRSAGSFITDGFKVGDEVFWTGFTNSANNGAQVITTLAATIMTCSGSSLVNESTVASTSCTTTGGGEEITVAAAGHTYTRSGTTTSFITEGFKVGMTAKFSGFANADNNGSHVLTVVTASVLTAGTDSLTDEAAYGISATATETDLAWQDSIEAIVGATPSTLVVSHKTMICGGRARHISGVDGYFKRRPASWPIVIRAMSKDVKTAPGRVSDQGLDGWTITTPTGAQEDHDERVSGGLLEMRIACLRTYAEIGINGVYCALAVTLDNDEAPMSLLNNGCVADIAANIVQGETTRKLQSDYELKLDGTLQPYELARINVGILNVLKQNLLSDTLGGTDPGARASDVTFGLDPGINLDAVGATQTTKTFVQFNGVLLKIDNRVVAG